MFFKIYCIILIYFLIPTQFIFSQVPSNSQFLLRQSIEENTKISDSLQNEFQYSKGFYSKAGNPSSILYIPQEKYTKGKFNQKGISYLPNYKISFLYDEEILENRINLLSYSQNSLNIYTANSKKQTHKYGFSVFDRRESVTFQILLRNYQIKKNYYGNSFLGRNYFFYGQDYFNGIVPGFVMDWKVSTGFSLRYKSEKLALQGKKEFLEQFFVYEKSRWNTDIGYLRGDAKIKGQIEEISFIFHFSKNFQVFISPYLREVSKEEGNIYPFFSFWSNNDDRILKSLISQQKFSNRVLSAHFYVQIGF